MEFRRIEVRKILRHQELIKDAVEIKKVIEALKSKNIKPSIKVKDMGPKMECAIGMIKTDTVELFVVKPSKILLNLKYDEIEQLEIECNSDFVAEMLDDGGRWSRLI